jgi:hypothetical protein
MVIKTYNIQLLENLIYLKLHPTKHEKLHSMNTYHLHIGQWMSQIFILKFKSYINA